MPRFTPMRNLVLAALLSTGGVADVNADASARGQLLEVIDADFRATTSYTGLRAPGDALRAALGAVPRERFVRAQDIDAAYDNRPLSIGHGQTISQPFIVALMTELAAVGAGSRVLEIGTGSGYQAAILAQLGARVWSVEIIAALSERAAGVLADLGYAVELRIGDGRLGWPDAAPFDAIIVTAGGTLPVALLDQLAPGGRLVIPLDQPGGEQMLTLFTRGNGGEILRRDVLPVRFVPLVGGNDAP